MTSFGPIYALCPGCGEIIELPVSATPGDWCDDGSIELNVSVDNGPIREHADQHRAEA